MLFISACELLLYTSFGKMLKLNIYRNYGVSSTNEFFCSARAVWLRFAAAVCWRSAAFFFDDTTNKLFLKLACTLLLLNQLLDST